MKVFFEKIEEYSSEIIDFYTVRLGENELNEIEKFDAKDFPHHSEEIEILYVALYHMQTLGAKEHYFKDEGPANAMPVVSKVIMDGNKEDYGIRLYCIRITDSLVVLLNGDIKTHIDPEMCNNVKEHFENAYKIANKLNKALADKEINFQEPGCLDAFEIEI